MKKQNLRVKRALEIQKLQKKLYQELDEILDDLVESKFKQNADAVLVDNFKNKSVLFKTTAIRRFGLESRKKTLSY